MMLVLDTPLATAGNDAGESPARRDVARALARMGFRTTLRHDEPRSARPDSDWAPLRARQRWGGSGKVPARNDDPTPDWQPL